MPRCFASCAKAHGQGAKIVLVITGKGRRGSDRERGVLKRQVPLWLEQPEFRSHVLGFADAHVGHGGEGALYVRIRSQKTVTSDQRKNAL